MINGPSCRRRRKARWPDYRYDFRNSVLTCDVMDSPASGSNGMYLFGGMICVVDIHTARQTMNDLADAAAVDKRPKRMPWCTDLRG